MATVAGNARGPENQSERSERTEVLSKGLPAVAGTHCADTLQLRFAFVDLSRPRMRCRRWRSRPVVDGFASSMPVGACQEDA